jgi:hypothetical protein
MPRVAFAVLATLASGCILEASSASDEQGFINAAWRFRTAEGVVTGCPEGFPLAFVTAKLIDAVDEPVPEIYNCEALSGSAGYDLGIYDVTIRITDNNGAGGVEGEGYATSLPKRVDIVITDVTVGEDFVTDGGRVVLAWTLTDAATSAAQDCAASGASEIALEMTGAAGVKTSKFACTDGAGISDPVAAGSYEASITALDAAGVPVGPAQTQTIEIGQPNVYQDVGVVVLPVD